MVGGRIIEITEIRPGLARLWCMDPKTHDECAVNVETDTIMPKPGDEIWWQAGKVYWDNDQRQLTKVGNSYKPFP